MEPRIDVESFPAGSGLSTDPDCTPTGPVMRSPRHRRHPGRSGVCPSRLGRARRGADGDLQPAEDEPAVGHCTAVRAPATRAPRSAPRRRWRRGPRRPACGLLPGAPHQVAQQRERRHRQFAPVEKSVVAAHPQQSGSDSLPGDALPLAALGDPGALGAPVTQRRGRAALAPVARGPAVTRPRWPRGASRHASRAWHRIIGVGPHRPDAATGAEPESGRCDPVGLLAAGCPVEESGQLGEVRRAAKRRPGRLGTAGSRSLSASAPRHGLPGELVQPGGSTRRRPEPRRQMLPVLGVGALQRRTATLVARAGRRPRGPPGPPRSTGSRSSSRSRIASRLRAMGRVMRSISLSFSET